MERKDEIQAGIDEIANDDEAFEAFMYETLAEQDLDLFLNSIRHMIITYAEIHNFDLMDVLDAMHFMRDPSDVQPMDEINRVTS